jgi:hypothetical protein
MRNLTGRPRQVSDPWGDPYRPERAPVDPSPPPGERPFPSPWEEKEAPPPQPPESEWGSSTAVDKENAEPVVGLGPAERRPEAWGMPFDLQAPQPEKEGEGAPSGLGRPVKADWDWGTPWKGSGPPLEGRDVQGFPQAKFPRLQDDEDLLQPLVSFAASNFSILKL